MGWAGKRRSRRPRHSSLTVVQQWGILFSAHAEKAARASLPAPCPHWKSVLPLESSQRRTFQSFFVLCFSCCSVYLKVLPSAFAQSHCWCIVFAHSGTNDHHGWAQDALLQAEVQPWTQVSRTLRTSVQCFLEISPQGGD